MSNLVLHRESQAIALPPPRLPGSGTIAIREAELKDVPFIDQLQRKHSRMVGWFPTKQIEGNIAKGKVLIAEEGLGPWALGTGAEPVHQGPRPSAQGPIALGYCISSDRYLKHDDCGIVYQLNVVPDKQRGLIGATLIKAVFDRAAYGCKLFCCWCAQDLQANSFWESLGFVPLAFRTGSRPRMRKDGTVSRPERIHIFWQRRIRAEENQANTGETPVPLTPYWFPSETSGGAVKENRLVLPIPPGTSWQDAKPAVLPGFDAKMLEAQNPRPESGGALPEGEGAKRQKRERKAKQQSIGPAKPKGGLWFAPPKEHGRDAHATKAEKRKRPREKFQNDPKLVEAARELRDKYIEQINAPGSAGVLLPPSTCGKYDVSRQLEAAPTAMKIAPAPEIAMLEAA